MPQNNAFRHQQYQAGQPAAPFRLLTPAPPPAVESDEFKAKLRAAGRGLRQAGVTSIILIHGTFVGDDYFDLSLMMERVSSRWAATNRRLGKRWIDWLFRDAGNYTEAYVQRMAAGINEPGEPPIDVRRFCWSGGNAHLPRAMGAIRLIDEIANVPLLDRRRADTIEPSRSRSVGQAVRSQGEREEALLDGRMQPLQAKPGVNGGYQAVAREQSSARVLCIAQSHGGNLLALMTNLLGGSRDVRKKLLDLVRNVPGKPNGGAWHTAWQRACERLDSDASAQELLRGRKLDLLTLGVPFRYGWDTGGYDHLLHIMNQRPVPELPPWRGRLPRTINQLLDGTYGDWVQQVGIAGSNFPLLALRWRRWRAERNLAALVQRGVPSYHVLRRMRLSLRVADEGPTLLVDYGLAQRGRRLRHVFGHGMYTHMEWMPFHLEQVVEAFYGENRHEPRGAEDRTEVLVR